MNYSKTLRRAVSRTPDAIAVVDGQTRWTFADLDGKVDALAHALAGDGIQPGEVVALLSGNRAEYLVVYFAVLRVGGILLPLNFRLAPSEVLYQLETARPVHLVVEDEHLDAIGPLAEKISSIRGRTVIGDTRSSTTDHQTWTSLEERLSEARTRGRHVDVPRAMDDVQRILFTSGTTSHPKAAQLTNGQVHFGVLIRIAELGLRPSDVNLVTGPLYHIGALDHFATAVLYLGGTVVVTRRFEPSEVLHDLQKHGVTVTWLSPSMLNLIFALPAIERTDVSSLRILLSGGEKTPEHLIRRVQATWENVGIYDAYGLTEGFGFAAYLPPEESVTRLGSVGRPTYLSDIEIVREDGTPAAPGERGEITIAGPTVFPGYLDSEATRSALRGGRLHTGDVGEWDEDGYLYVVDRLKDMIRSGGENIASSEVERVVYAQPGVREVAVVAAEDARWGEVPVAFVVMEPGAELVEEDMIVALKQELAGFKVPRTFHVVSELPRTASGKVQKSRLRERLDSVSS